MQCFTRQLKVIMATLGSVAQVTSYQPELMALQGCFLFVGTLPANHPPSLCPSPFPCTEGHIFYTRRSAAARGSNPAELQTTLPPLTSVLPPSEMNLSHLPSPAPSSQQREPQPCLPGPLSLCARADTCAGAAPVAPGGARGKGRALGGMRDSKGTGISDVSRQDNTINNQSIPTKSLSA